jgi:hypothetical protein
MSSFPSPLRRALLALACTLPLLVIAAQSAFSSAPLLDPPPFTVTNRLFLPNGNTAINSNPPTPTLAPFDWLSYVNSIRSLANLPPVTENPDWSAGDVLHAKYMVKNQVVGHTEDKTNPFYTFEGEQAGANGNAVISSDFNVTDKSLIDAWVAGPFHALGIIDLRLQQSGYGAYREDGQPIKSGATFDVLRGRATGPLPAGITYPIYWPANGKTVDLTRYGGESPDPLTSCAGFTSTVGLPIYLLIGDGDVDPAVTASSFKQGSTELANCRFDGTNYSNPTPADQTLGRGILRSRSAIVLIPRAPLVPGKSYTASITTNGQTYTWTFNVAADAS